MSFEEIEVGQARPERRLRSDQAKQPQDGAPGGQSTNQDEAFDPLSLVEAVDVCAQLSKGWTESVLQAPKWKVKKDKLVELKTAAQTCSKIAVTGELQNVVNALTTLFKVRVVCPFSKIMKRSLSSIASSRTTMLWLLPRLAKPPWPSSRGAAPTSVVSPRYDQEPARLILCRCILHQLFAQALVPSHTARLWWRAFSRSSKKRKLPSTPQQQSASMLYSTCALAPSARFWTTRFCTLTTKCPRSARRQANGSFGVSSMLKRPRPLLETPPSRLVTSFTGTPLSPTALSETLLCKLWVA